MKPSYRMRQWYLLIGILLFAVSMTIGGSPPVFAQSGSITSSAVVSNGTPTVGDQINVVISIDMSAVDGPDDALGSFKGSLAYNPAVLAYNTYSGFPPAGFMGLINPTSGEVTFNGANAMGATDNVTVLTITFDVIGAGSGDLALSYSAMAAAGTFANLLSLPTTFSASDVQATGGASAEITLDGSVSSGTADDVSSISFGHTTGTGLNRLMLVGVSWNCGSTNRTISSVTFTPSGGSATTLVPVRTEQTGTQLRYSAIYRWPDGTEPPTGVAGNVAVNFSGSVSNGIVAGAANFAGVDQTTPLGPSNGANGNSTAPSVALSGLDGDELVFDNVFQGAQDVNQTLTAGADQTQQWNGWIANTRAAASTEGATGDSVTMSWTAASSSYWAVVAVAINPAAVGTTYNLTMASDGNGTTTPAVGVHTYAENEVVSISATPNPGYTFDSWTGDADCADGSVAMDGDKTCTATFTQDEYTLTVNVVGTGSVSKDPNQATYHYADVVNVTATADPGWSFAGWSGACTGTGACQVIMDGNKSVTATFVETPEGQVTLDGSFSSNTADGVSSISFDHTTGTGLNRLMLVGVSANSYNGARTISSVTFTPSGGSTTVLALVGSVENEAGRLAAIYSLLNPPSGATGTVTVTFSGSVGYGIVAGAANFAGVDQTDPLDDFVSAVGTESAAINVNVPTDPNDVVFDTVFLGGSPIPSLTVDASQTALWNASIDRVRGAASIEQATSTTTAMSWTASGTTAAYYWAVGAVPINPAVTGTTYNLTTNVVGGGSITLDPAGGTYPEDTVVNVTATADPGWSFAGWSGACTGTGACQVTMDGDKSVTATFTQNEYTLTVNVVGTGSVSKDPNQATYHYADVVDLTATPAAGWSFAGWSGACTGSGACVVTMDGDKTVTATFTQDEYTLTLNVVGNGSVSKDPDQATYHYGDVVDVTALPDLGWSFDSWSGACTGSGACQVTMDGDKSVTATFTQITHDLTMAVDPAAGGTTDPVVGVHPYAEGTVVGISATPAAGYTFDGWTGDDDCADGSVTMDGDKSCTATFSEIVVVPEVTLALEPSATTVDANQTFDVVVWVRAGEQPLNSASAYVNFDPAVLSVLSMTPGVTLDEELQNGFDNGLGNVNYAAGVLGEENTVSGEFVLLTITFKAVAESAGTPVIFERTAPLRTSDVQMGGVSVLDDVVETTIVVINTFDLTMAVDPAAGGTTDPVVGVHPYAEGTVVGISATPAAGYTFDGWTGDDDCADGSVTMDGDKSCTATFSQITQVTGSVQLQGRGTRPNASWIVPLAVKFYVPGETDPVYEFTPTTDENGMFDLQGILPGAYTVSVKNSHTLQNVRSVTIVAGANTMDLGVLREGDVNDDNLVTLADFSILAVTFGKAEGDAGYDGRADLNGDGMVTLNDFVLLAANFATSGDALEDVSLATTISRLADASDGSDAKLVLRPSDYTVSLDDEFDVDIVLQAGSHSVDAVAANLLFDPSLFEVVSVTGSDALNTVLVSRFDNVEGKVVHEAGILGDEFLEGEVTVATVHFRALAATEASAITFVPDGFDAASVYQAGENVLKDTAGMSITISDEQSEPQTEPDFKIVLPGLFND